MTWEQRAACAGKPPHLFEYQDTDSPEAIGLKYKDRFELNTGNLHEAQETCIECPVMFECLAAASPSERKWTVRGGEPPARYLVDLESYVHLEAARGARGPRPKLEPGDRICTRGHMVKGGGRCRACKRQANKFNNRKYRARARQAEESVGQ